MKNLSLVNYIKGRPYIYGVGHVKGREIIRRYYGVIRICKECKNEFFALDGNIKKGNGIYCSFECAHKLENNPRWLGESGKPIDNGYGYLMAISRNHPFKNSIGYVLQHRLIVEKYIGRYLKLDEIVHHVNKNRIDNRIKNLMVLKNHGSHLNLDRWGTINPNHIIFDGSKV